ncbi:MAG TPA: hypothetical protein VHE61_01740 [Opitutaceae bacterium]|nr:hypothetical protein [Opitutaceae bacterium]
MKWVVVAIVVFIAGYTYLTLHFRKPGPDYRPYEDMRNRANTLRLLSAGYQRIELPAERPLDSGGAHDNTFPAPGGVPGDLNKTIVTRPLLPAEILGARAAASGTSSEPYSILFRCVVPDDQRQLAGAEMYIRRNELVITPDFEILARGLQTRSRNLLVLLTVPPHTLKSGSYRVLLVGDHASRAWTVTIR